MAKKRTSGQIIPKCRDRGYRLPKYRTRSEARKAAGNAGQIKRCPACRGQWHVV